MEVPVSYSERWTWIADSGKFGSLTYEIHWISIVDSFVLVLLLVIFVAVLVFRIVRKDFAKIVMDEEEFEGKEEVGWKKISNDIFRPP